MMIQQEQAYSDLDVNNVQSYDSYGRPETSHGTFGFTGEQTHASGQLFLRARYYA